MTMRVQHTQVLTLMLQRIFANKFLWGNFAASLMMNDCEKSSRHLWLLRLMNAETNSKL